MWIVAIVASFMLGACVSSFIHNGWRGVVNTITFPIVFPIYIVMMFIGKLLK